MSTYTDYLIYTQNNAYFNLLNTGNVISSQRDGHYVLLKRSKLPITLTAQADLLATGNCTTDCPFAKLTGTALEKYKLAYNTEPYTVTEQDESGEETQKTIEPTFRFGVFI